MKYFAMLLMLLGLGGFAVGCSEEQDVREAVDELQEERQETVDEANQALEDDVVTEDELEDVREERQETEGQVGEVIEQSGQLIEERAEE